MASPLTRSRVPIPVITVRSPELTAPFSVVELDTTCHCVAPATAIALNNSVYMLSNQGVVKLASSGVTVVSFDIEPVIMSSTINLPSAGATLGVTDNTTMIVNSTGNTVPNVSVAFGTLQLGANNALPTTTSLVLGQSGSAAT